jgi:hypothetical protein
MDTSARIQGELDDIRLLARYHGELLLGEPVERRAIVLSGEAQEGFDVLGGIPAGTTVREDAGNQYGL